MCLICKGGCSNWISIHKSHIDVVCNGESSSPQMNPCCRRKSGDQHGHNDVEGLMLR